MTASIRQVIVASFIGTTIEWYDYFIFVTAASLVFSDVFFPGFGETAGTILSYLTFAVGGTTLNSIYIAALCALSVLCYALAAETYRKDIYEEDPEERQLLAGQG